MNFEEDLKGVADFWGDKMPMMAMEEAGEFIQAVSKMERKGGEKERQNLLEELVDMYISTRAIEFHYGFSQEEILEQLNKKLNTKKER